MKINVYVNCVEWHVAALCCTYCQVCSVLYVIIIIAYLSVVADVVR